MDNLFSTHPATENRIAALEQLAHGDGPRRLPLGGARLSRAARAGPWGERRRRAAAASPWG